MQLKDILTLSRTSYHAHISSKKKVLEFIAQMIANDFPQIQANDVFDALIQRERLGSTAIGHGVAIPHCKLKNLDTAIAVLMLLDTPINYGSIDKQPVDIILALVIPEESQELHLELLSLIAKRFSEDLVREQLRHATDKENLYQLAIA